MRGMCIVAVAIAGMGINGAAQASGAFTGRVGLTAGTYEFNDKAIDQGCCGNPIGTEFTSEDNTGQYGVLVGTGLAVARFFVDLGIEYVKYDSKYDTDFDGVEDTAFYRTDGLLTLGVFVGDRWTVFGGFRHATFGDGFFSEDNGNTEEGPFLGGGVSFRAGDSVLLGASAAYNKVTLSQEGQPFDDVDLNGFSAKFQMSFLGTPHSVFLRWQRFDGDQSVSGSFDYEYTEDYINLGYQATFDFVSW